METLIEQALGTTITITGTNAGLAFSEIQRLERILTRFKPSALTKLNQQGFLEFPPIELVDALQHALRVAKLTSGLVTPTVLTALEQTGYTKSWNPEISFELSDKIHEPAPGFQDIVVSPEHIILPKNTRIELGGTAKTWIAQQVASLFEKNFLIDLGGDIFVRQSESFVINIATPDNQPLAFELPAGTWGVCTSSTQKRAWQGGHHLIDPRTGSSLESRFVQVSAVANLATTAEMICKLAFFGADVVRPFESEFQVLLAFNAEHKHFCWENSSFTESE